MNNLKCTNVCCQLKNHLNLIENKHFLGIKELVNLQLSCNNGIK